MWSACVGLGLGRILTSDLPSKDSYRAARRPTSLVFSVAAGATCAVQTFLCRVLTAHMAAITWSWIILLNHYCPNKTKTRLSILPTWPNHLLHNPPKKTSYLTRTHPIWSPFNFDTAMTCLSWLRPGSAKGMVSKHVTQSGWDGGETDWGDNWMNWYKTLEPKGDEMRMESPRSNHVSRNSNHVFK